MKHLFLPALLICCLNCFSQDPNPLLFQTWYLRSVQSSDLSPMHDVLLITPSISPTLTISNTLEFTGQGACNAFSGTATATNNQWYTTTFSEAAADCGITVHNQFEDNYFGSMQYSSFYTIYPEGSGLSLVMNTFIFGQAVFQNFPLKTEDFELERISVYPNPVKSVLHLDSGQLSISKIQIINSLGQTVKTINNDFEEVAIADLPAGIYILKIDTELGIIGKKIIKE